MELGRSKKKTDFDPGRLNRLVQIQSLATAQDSFGQPQQSWTTVATTWACIDIQQSQLIYATSEFVDKQTYRITTRWTASVVFKPSMRIVYTDAATNITHTYSIKSIINPLESNFWLTFLCYELNGAA
jgi:head-tail adaptor